MNEQAIDNKNSADTPFILRPIMVWLMQSARDGEMHWSTITVPASYVIGGVASYWMIDRIAGFWT